MISQGSSDIFVKISRHFFTFVTFFSVGIASKMQSSKEFILFRSKNNFETAFDLNDCFGLHHQSFCLLKLIFTINTRLYDINIYNKY